ncbi:GntR family transcriptional regulator [Rothia sp. (in: high G+C Gram-positive bacteria)]|uniref:GntR family transcriptional regulator n=1 Tax=Rothia sp. (in: high G+C Gram-positive bacteria) TaxID=1885016 RepID=UPI00321727FE
MTSHEMPLAHGPHEELCGGICALNFKVDKESDVPPYSQLRRSIIAARSDGTLAAGDRLPPMRTLATQTGLAVNTVAKAYKELEAAGAIETHGRAGSFVTALDATSHKAQLLTEKFIVAMRKLGYEDQQIHDTVDHMLGLDRELSSKAQSPGSS